MVGMNEVVCPHCKKAFKVDEAGRVAARVLERPLFVSKLE